MTGVFGDLNGVDLANLFRLIDTSSLLEVELTYGEFYVHVRKDKAGRAEALTPSTESQSAIAHPVCGVEAKVQQQTVRVQAPMLGNFYRSPSPGEPPFVQVGQHVNASDPVGLIEVMKLFNQVTAGSTGRVVEIQAQDGELVEHGRVLLLIEVEETPNGVAPPAGRTPEGALADPHKRLQTG